MGYVPNARMKNVFMAVAMDLPDFKSPFGRLVKLLLLKYNKHLDFPIATTIPQFLFIYSIHPRDKSTVGARLAVSGLAVAYSKPYKYQGPQPSAFFIDIGFFTLGIEFDNRTTEIQVRNKDGFEVSFFVTMLSKCLE